MSLALGAGPLAGGDPERSNFSIDGPAHRLYGHPVSQRMRATFAGSTVFDTTAGMLLHETGLKPALYVPAADFDEDLLEPTERSSHCPFKGDAGYWTVKAEGREAQNAVWAYPQPNPESAWLSDYRSVYWDAMDTWLEEDEPIFGGIRDPFHRVDVLESTRRVRVLAEETVIAESERPLVLAETGLPARFYLPLEDVLVALEPSETSAVCPYKGTSSYRSAKVGERLIEDAGWVYEQPLEEASGIAGRICFSDDDLTVELDGARMP